MKSSKVKVFLTVIFCSFLMACSSGVKREDLVGRWNYVSYEYANKSLEKPVGVDLSVQKPYIQFDQNGNCQIISSNKVLSSGSYYLEDKIIRYKENFADGQKRAIPFLIKSLTKRELVFQTMDAEAMLITAVKN